MVDHRIVCWFSCGAASAVATKLAIKANAGKKEIVIARCYIAEEHPDNDRFADECEQWFGLPIIKLIDEKHQGSIYNVFESQKYIAGIAGAPCTRILKKRVRESFQRINDIHVFGYTVEEQHRADRFIDANNDVNLWSVLIENGLTHDDCLAIVKRAGIELPAMYKLGYRNNNCIGCVKGGAGYWNKIRIDFPDTFERMSKLERKIGASICKEKGQRIYLDELNQATGNYKVEPEVECGIFCEMAESQIK
jgi:hypothetical protein